MNLLEVLSNGKDYEGESSRIYGAVIGIVTNNNDPDSLGRIKVKFPWLKEDEESMWARLASPMAGKDRGMIFLPEVEDEVLVVFDHGDVRQPYILGALWNGKDEIPAEKKNDDKNDKRIIKSRSNHLIILDDKVGSEKIEIIASNGKNKIIIDSKENKITLEVAGDIELKAASGKIVLDAKSVEIKSSAETKIDAGATMDVKATGTMNIKGQPVNLN